RRRLLDPAGDHHEGDAAEDRRQVDAVEDLHHIEPLDEAAATRRAELPQRRDLPLLATHPPIIDGMSLASPYGPKADAGPPGLAAKLLGFCDELRSEGVAVGSAEVLDALAPREVVGW